MNVSKLVAVAALTLPLLAACESSGYGTKQTIGALGGAAAGGLVGAQFGSGSGKLAATALGAVLGGFLGSEIGRSMDDVDRMKAQQAYAAAGTAPIGQTITWNNPDTGHSGSVTPVRDGYAADGSYCREFSQTVVIDGKYQSATGVACKQADGTWRIRE